MKPRNFVINILLMLVFIAQMIISLLTTWELFFFGLVGVIILIPELILSVKHGIAFIIYKAIFQVLVSVLGAFCALYGFVLYLAYEVAKDLAMSCGGNITHSKLDEFGALFNMLVLIPIVAKIIMNIVDFATYRKERKKLTFIKEEEN